MADRYWVGGAGEWNGSDTIHWSATSGGAAGASAPIAADLVFFDGSSGSGTVTLAATATAQNLTTTASSITLQLAGNVTLAGIITLTNGTIDLTTFNLSTAIFLSNNANARTLAFGAGKIVLTGNANTIWNTSTITNLTVTGAPVVDCTYSGATGTRTILTGALAEASSISFNITAGTDTVSLQNRYRNLNFTGFAGTLANNARSIYGSLTISTGMTLTAGTQLTSMLGTSGPYTITTNGKTLDFPLTFGGSGGTWAFADALTQGSTRALTLGAGTTVKLKSGVTSTVGALATTGGAKTLQSTVDGSQATLSQASGTVNATSLTVKDINATGGAVWNAPIANRNVDAGGNSGWNFAPASSGVASGRGLFSGHSGIWGGSSGLWGGAPGLRT